VHGHHRAAEPVRAQYNNHSGSVYGNAGTVYGSAGNAAREMREAMPVAAPVESVQNKPQADNKANIDIFDIPAFLRKQAD